jgi:hypothetical protein
MQFAATCADEMTNSSTARSPNMPSRDESGLIKNEFGRKSSGKQVSAVIIHELLRARGNKNAILPLHAPPVYIRARGVSAKNPDGAILITIMWRSFFARTRLSSHRERIQVYIYGHGPVWSVSAQ